MNMLSKEAQARARDFIKANARDLEQALYAYTFEDGSSDAVYEALAAYQNEDGGFGHGLEPDLQLADSSVLATTVAFQHLRAMGASVDNPLVRGGMAYLMAMYNPDIEAWPIIPPNVDDAPHAPWWVYDDDLASRWGGFLVNPRAEIIGYLHDYPSLAPGAMRDALTRAVVAYAEQHAGEIGMFDVLCYVRLVGTEALPASVRDRLMTSLAPVVEALVVKDPCRWDEYVLTPLEVVDGPDAPFAALLSDSMAANLDHEIAHQAENGAWEPKWTWGGLHPEAWARARQAWSGILTVRTLHVLRRFDRLA
jgi:hypothetical protein